MEVLSNSALRTVIAGGQGITATTSNTLYAENLNVKKSFDAGFLTTGTTTLTTGYVILGFTGTTGGTVTISSSDAAMGRMFIIKDQGGNAGTNNIVIDTEGVETIDGAASVTITDNYGVVRLYSDGSNLFTW